jgi:hypothetical protein
LLEFNHVSAYKSLTTGDSVEIFVRDSVTSTPFTFITFDKATLTKSENVCTGATASAGYTFVKLINQFLFLKTTTPTTQYWVCQYIETASGLAPI